MLRLLEFEFEIALAWFGLVWLFLGMWLAMGFWRWRDKGRESRPG